MTEIPEHLLRRSKAAKSEKAGGPAPAEDSGAAAADAGAATPATTAGATPAARPAAAAPVEATPEPPKPVPPYVAAHRRRRRIPVWALPVVVFLPVWALGFAGTMQLPTREDPLFEEAASIYLTSGGCAGCHGASGGGGVGYQLSGGEVLATFPEPIDHMAFVAIGSEGVGIGNPYGDPQRPGGQHEAGGLGVMPAFAGSLSLEELQLVVFHERAILSGEDVASSEYEAWMEELRHEIEAGTETPIDDEVLALLLRCANPEHIPVATGDATEEDTCPGPHGEGEE